MTTYLLGKPHIGQAGLCLFYPVIDRDRKFLPRSLLWAGILVAQLNKHCNVFQRLCIFAYDYFIFLGRVTSPSAKPPFLEGQFLSLSLASLLRPVRLGRPYQEHQVPSGLARKWGYMGNPEARHDSPRSCRDALSKKCSRIHKTRQNKKRRYKKRTRDLWNTRREIQTQTKLDQPSWKNGQHETPETRPRLQILRKKRSWTPKKRWQRIDAGTGQTT